MDAARDIHSTAFVAAGLLLLGAGLLLPLHSVPDSATLPLLLLVLLLGLPHGAMDLFISKKQGLWTGAASFFWFHLAYLTLAAGTVLAFVAMPFVALLTFLLLSIWHFADDWEDVPKAVRLGATSVIVLGPTISHTEGVRDIFATLTGVDIQLSGSLPYPFILVSAWLIAGSITAVVLSNRRAGLELLIIAGLSAVLPPLLFFAVYFTLLHSPRHLLRYESLVSRGRSRAALLLYTALAIVIVVGLGLLLDRAVPLRENDAIVRATFIGLAALTLPHMVLLEYERLSSVTQRSILRRLRLRSD
jgi:Brp/Blh family beta-carotene 15,15'-monooxygenase